MKLQIFKAMKYVSPSSFLKWGSCQYRTYLTRLAGYPYMEQRQGLGAAIGTAFDAFIKDYIAIKRRIEIPHLSLNNLLKKNISEEHREKAIEVGKQIAKIYIEIGWAQEFIDHRGDLLLEQELHTVHNGIPILGQLDLIKDTLVNDWKTRGFASKSGAYPTKDYCARVDYNTVTNRIITNMKIDQTSRIEESNPPWAIQMLFYNWLLKNIPYNFEIHEICKHGDMISFVKHKGLISLKFGNKIMEELREMWSAITDQLYFAEIEEPTPRCRICEAYSSLCEAAHICKYYGNTLANPERRKNYE